jgi:hypothetical protein
MLITYFVFIISITPTFAQSVTTGGFIIQGGTPELSGYGATFNSNIIIEEKAQEMTKIDEKTGKEVKIKEQKKIYKAWIRGCQNVELPEKRDPFSIKNGERIKVRLSAPRSCSVADWEKF